MFNISAVVGLLTCSPTFSLQRKKRSSRRPAQQKDRNLSKTLWMKYQRTHHADPLCLVTLDVCLPAWLNVYHPVSSSLSLHDTANHPCVRVMSVIWQKY